MSDDTERAGPQGQEGSETGQPELEQPYDASDPEQVQQRKRDAGRRSRQEREVLRQVMSTIQGRAWLWGLLSGCHMFASSYTSERTHDTAFNEGERNVGLKLNSQMLLADPKAYVQMQTENGKGL